MMRTLVLLFAVMALLPGQAETVYRTDIPCFRVEQDKYAVRNDATASWTESGAYEIAVPKLNFWMEYNAFPGSKPIPGPAALELETDGEFAAVLEIQIVPFPSGKTLSFKAERRPVTRFETKLDPDKLYQIKTFVVNRRKWDKKPWRMAFRRLTAEYRTTEARALRFDCETGNHLRLVRRERGERAALAIDNLAAQPIAVEGDLTLKGSLGEPVPLPVKTTLPAAGRTCLPLPPVTLKGVWRVTGKLRTGDGSVADVDARFAFVDHHEVTPRQPFGTFRLGINYHYGRYSRVDQRLTIDALVACGAKLVRSTPGTSMSAVQPTGPNDENFGLADRMIEALEDAGIALNAGIHWIPKWAARPEYLDRDYHWWARGRAQDGVFENFCEKLARHFGTRIDYYEIGNEWDLGFRGTVEDAIAIQKEAYTGLKRGCKDVCVISNGWTTPEDTEQIVRSGHEGFREAALKGMAPYMDVMPIHIHSSLTTYVRKIEEGLFPLMRRTGLDGKRWYSNETAFTSVWEERGPALLVWKKILYAWSAGSQDYIWYNLKGTGWNPKDAEQGYGMITADYRPRETFVAFAALATAFGGKTFKRTVFRKASRFCLEFAQKGGLTLGAWDESAAPEDVRVTVETDAKSAVRIDVFGNRKDFPVENGKVDFVFGSNPAALVLDGATFATPDHAALEDIPPPKVKAIVIPAGGTSRRPDFVLDDHRQVTDFFQANPKEVERLWKGPADLSAKIWLGCDADGLDVTLAVTDDVQVAPEKGSLQYKGDDVQLALASHLQRGHWEFGLARQADGAGDVYCWIAPGGCDPRAAEKAVRLETRREGTVTTYKAHFPYKALGFEPKLMKQGFRFNVLINDNDGDARDAAIEIKGGNFGSKSFGAYPFVRFE